MNLSIGQEEGLDIETDGPRDDTNNSRGPTSGEKEFYGRPKVRTDRGLLAPPSRGPLANIDLLYYMRTGIVRTLDGRCLNEDQKGLR